MLFHTSKYMNQFQTAITLDIMQYTKKPFTLSNDDYKISLDKRLFGYRRIMAYVSKISHQTHDLLESSYYPTTS